MSVKEFFKNAFTALAGLLVVTAVSSNANGQNASYDAPFNASANVTADGIISPGEWDGAGAESSTFGVLREGPEAVDSDNNRFRMMWDNDNLYILFQSDYTLGFKDTVGGNPDIVFGDENLNFYFDPNTDGGENVATNPETAGYQLAFNQYIDIDDGITISTNDDRQGVGFYTEAHFNSPNGDQAEWNEGGSNVGGAALGTIVVAQNNTASGALAEIVIPWADFDALEFFVPDPILDPDNKVLTGLNHTTAPTAGDQWFLEVGVITRHPAGSNFLPVWDFHSDGSFTNRNEGHGTLNFTGGSGGVAGDANGDGNFDFGDIEAFFLALTDSAAYAAQYPDVAISLLDMNADGNTDFGDIEAFFTALTAG